ncbi:MAG TPA: lipid kinase [Gammaproteobacteria bacterium]|nr:lipid kinase [Gammaproteobacteria bacterium]
MSNRRALLIVNPKSRRGDTDLEAARRTLEERGIDLRQETPGDAAGVVRLIESRAGEVDCVVLGGGDGTLNCAAAALVAARLPLGILPLGTANDLARTLGLPMDAAAAAAVIADGHVKPIDVGRVNDVHFFNAADIGLGTRVTAHLDRRTKSRWGVLAYPRSLLRAWRDNRAFTAEIDCDGRRELLRVIQIKIANGKYYGGGMSVLEDAAIDDQRLDLLAIRPQGILSLLRLAPALRAGEARDSRGVQVRSGRKVSVLTAYPMQVSTDGEITSATPAHFAVMAGAIEVYVPAAHGDAE